MLLLFSCRSSPFDVNIDHISIEQKFIRLDQEVFHSAMDDPSEIHHHLSEIYPNIFKEYYENILHIGAINDSTSIKRFGEMRTQEVWRDVQLQIDSVFFDDAEFRNAFLKAFKYYRYHFPKEKIPSLVAMNTGLNYGIYPLNDMLGVGLEFYLGKDHWLTQGLPIENFPNYQKAKMDKNYLVTDALRGYLLSTKQNNINGRQLIDHLVYQGKIMYILNALVPYEKEYLQMGYNEDQLDWCYKNEFNIWKSIIDDDLVYSTNLKQIERFTGFGPFTQGFPKDSPGMISLFLGKQIVKDHMEKNKDKSLSQLLNETNSLEILKNYKPNK